MPILFIKARPDLHKIKQNIYEVLNLQKQTYYLTQLYLVSNTVIQTAKTKLMNNETACKPKASKIHFMYY